MTAIGPFSTDMYLPSFPSIARDLRTSVAAVGYSLTSYFIGISVGQLFYGPITDRFGRKGPLLAGLALYVVAAVLSAFSPTLGWLVAFRFLMAFGACGGLVASRAMIMDLFPIREIASILSSFMLIIALSPLLAPTIGGYLAAGPGWYLIFLSLAACVAVLFLAALVALPESRKPDAAVSLRPAMIARRYRDVAADRRFLVYASASGTGSAALFAYVASAAPLLMELHGLSQAQFGAVFALIAAGLVGGSQVNRLLLKRFHPARITKACVAAETVIGVALVALALSGRLSLPLLLLLLPAYLFCVGMVNPNTTTLALEPFAKTAGSASALVGSFQMAFGAAATAAMSAFAAPSPLPLAASFLICAVGGMVLLSAAPKADR